ncbi:uncharacterized protein C11orf87 homolog [Denticeps clupeoides]|uniref:Uncharacterized protein n=1 Tax=Denticeps clupeoides TaxID=299321 RepID=A0AAY4CAR6_9TELE|nr:uncharacterized protein C11orf87 homolog [Denticeps clupeoides]XP_028818039.1 uncharacterized protein C11orf87 homolog [Denticeps clupeoides]
MSARTPEDPALSIPHCSRNGTGRTNGTCVVPMEQLLQAFSSTAVLFVLVAVIVGIVLVSLATFHVHKSKMKKRKIQRAQEEYERDSRSPGAAKGKPAGGQRVMVRPARSRGEPVPDTRHTGQTGELESVAVS